MLRVRTNEGYEVEVTAGHKFAYWDTYSGRFSVKPIETFLPGDALYALIEPAVEGERIFLRPPRKVDPKNATTTIEMTFPEELDERLAYVIGLTYGDTELRTVYPYGLRVAFCKDNAGQASAKRFSDYCKQLFGGRPIVLEDFLTYQVLGFTRKRLVDFLVVNNLAKGKAGNLVFPSSLFCAEPGIRAAFVAGLIDADGTYRQRGGWSISSIDRTFLIDLQRLLLSLGVPSKLKLSRQAKGNWQTLYRLNVVGYTFIDRLVQYILPYSAKAQLSYIPSPGADKGWGYRPSLFNEFVSRIQQRGSYHLVERTLGATNETSGYRAVATLTAHPETAVAAYAKEISTCVQLTLESVTSTEVAETYDIEVEDDHLLSANGIYASNTRRAAKMVILNVDHPDIEEFIWCKAIEERKARVLEAAGFDMTLDGKDFFSVQYQNANNSVRVTDDFMQAVIDDQDWALREVTTGKVVKTVKAKQLFNQISEAAHECADPGMQFDTTINKWHTVPNAGRINASNPCSEYMHLDNSACNLASINLLAYLKEDNSFDIEAFKHTIELVITAQEILVGYSEYPTEKMTKNARAFRELGLGYANLGALLMAQGLPYDSDEGRAQAAAITALMTGHAYTTSAKIARMVGPFAGYLRDREAMLNVLQMHREEVSHIDAGLVSEELLSAAASVWDEVVEYSQRYGVRNSQVSLLAPTGTIGLMMDCDTTGIEPDLGLVKLKKLVGGGTMNIVNHTVPRALNALDYSSTQVEDIVNYIDTEKTILGAPHLKKEHKPVFACSMGDNAIHYQGHVKMMAAVQPFLSGAISKTVNMPENVTVEEVEQLHIDAWKMGLKAVAIYRDNCKLAQPLTMAKKEDNNQAVEISNTDLTTASSTDGRIVVKGAIRRALPRRRNSKTYKFRIADLKGYFTVGEYDDGTPGELFISVSKQGSAFIGSNGLICYCRKSWLAIWRTPKKLCLEH